MGDETCIHHFESTFKQKLMEWCYVTSSRITKEEETQECAMSLKSHRYRVLGWDVLFLRTSRPGDRIEFWQLLYWNAKKSDCPHMLTSSHKKSEMLLLHNNARAQTCAHHGGCYRFWMGSIAASTIWSWPHFFKVSLVWFFDREPARTSLCQR